MTRGCLQPKAYLFYHLGISVHLGFGVEFLVLSNSAAGIW